MPIKFKNKNMGIIKGDVPLKSVMIGSKCVYGYDLAAFKISYPSISKGTGIYIEVNGDRKISNPATLGELDVHYDDNVVIKTYAEAGYENPVSSVVAEGNPITGTDYAINRNGISVVRSTTYSFTVKGDSTITIAQALPAPKVNISVNKDAGVGTVGVYYDEGPYGYSGLDNSLSGTVEDLFVASGDTIKMYIYSKISTRNPYSVAKEGYKIMSTNKNFAGLLTADIQCAVTAVSQAGERVSIICPPIQDGVDEYALTMVSSEYSRNVYRDLEFYIQKLSAPSQTSVEISKRHYDEYYFYKGDRIRITAVRKDGFKLPSLGIQGNISALVTSKEIVLSDENVLVVESGEQGIPVRLINKPLATKEFVYIDVTSDYTNNSVKKRESQIYVGDRIMVPLSIDYRIGTRSYRKPGVGFSADGNVLREPTFTSDATLQVPNVSELTIVLQQGAARISTAQFQLADYVARFSRMSNISPMEITYSSIRGKRLTPVPGYGYEDYFLDDFDMTYSCKRYWLDAITSKYNKIRQTNVPMNFSYTYDCDIFSTKVVIAGTYKIDEDGKGVKLTVSEYDTDWVANTSEQAKLIPRTIRI